MYLFAFYSNWYGLGYSAPSTPIDQVVNGVSKMKNISYRKIEVFVFILLPIIMFCCATVFTINIFWMLALGVVTGIYGLFCKSTTILLISYCEIFFMLTYIGLGP